MEEKSKQTGARAADWLGHAYESIRQRDPALYDKIIGYEGKQETTADQRRTFRQKNKTDRKEVQEKYLQSETNTSYKYNCHGRERMRRLHEEQETTDWCEGLADQLCYNLYEQNEHRRRRVLHAKKKSESISNNQHCGGARCVEKKILTESGSSRVRYIQRKTVDNFRNSATNHENDASKVIRSRQMRNPKLSMHKQDICDMNQYGEGRGGGRSRDKENRREKLPLSKFGGEGASEQNGKVNASKSRQTNQNAEAHANGEANTHVGGKVNTEENKFGSEDGRGKRLNMQELSKDRKRMEDFQEEHMPGMPKLKSQKYPNFRFTQYPSKLSILK